VNGTDRKYTKTEVGYVVSLQGAEHCRGCANYEGELHCAIVEGLILRQGWCRRWIAPAKAA
jgi:hypothetical protein